MQTRTRVALVALHFAEYSARLAAALAADADVLLILYRNNADSELGPGWQKLLASPQLEIVALDRPRSILSIVRNTWRLVSIVKVFVPTVIHYQEVTRDELMLSMPFFRSLPKVLTVHDPTPHSGIDSKRLELSRHRMYRFLIRRSANAAIAHGKFLAKALEEVCPWLKGKVNSIGHGPLGMHDGLAHARRPMTLRLLFFGRIHKYKGLTYFIEAVIRLRREGLAVVGVVAGTGSDLEEHRDTMLAAGCFEVIDQYIAAADVPRLFLEARAVVLPYVDGTQSGVAAIALGCGRPVIASRVGSIPELVRNGQNGLLVAPTDVDALTAAIRSVVVDDELWEKLASGARELRDGELAWRVLAAQTLDVYESVQTARRGGRGSPVPAE